MNIEAIAAAPQSSGSKLHTYLVSEKNLDETANYIKNQYGDHIDVDKASTEKGSVNHYFSRNEKISLIGLGDLSNPYEGLRRATHTAVSISNDFRFADLFVAYVSDQEDSDATTAMAESSVLSNYQFLAYKNDPKVNKLSNVQILSKSPADVKKGHKIARAAQVARDLVNEPVITLTATELAERAAKHGKEFGFKTEILEESQIKSLKMGGLLSVNLGSLEPPTFTIMEWKPANASNSKPIVLVGKGVVYDTGGLSLKPTANSMDFMKSDMAGGAAVVGTMCGVAAMELPLHVIGLVPATDNRPGQNAYTPGDVIRMHDGSTVEVLNTDAEGRLLLADALSYAKKYDPELVIDLATLTGAQVVAIGTVGIAMMGSASEETKADLKTAGNHSHERLVELPLWEEYRDQLKSDIADLKNIGGSAAGCITAGKFLEHFTDYSWLHLDIAGPAFLQTADSYRGKNGTGVGVRLLLRFLENYS